MRYLLLLLVTPLSLHAQAPNLNPPFPCGAQRGKTLELTFTGQNVQEPLGVVASFPVKATFVAPLNDPFKVVARLEIPADAPLGWHTIRLHTKRGLSNIRPFCIDELPQTLQTGTPFTAEQAQSVTLPTVVCGTMQPQQRHFYAIKLEQNQRLCAEILGRRLGSPLDPALTLYDAATGRQLEFADDSPGLQKDARFAFIAPKAGTYHLEVRDVRYSGGGDWHYRLRLGDFPLASTAFPLAIQRGHKATLTFAGPLVDGTQSVEVTAPDDPTLQAINVTPRFKDKPGTQAGWPVQVVLSDLPERPVMLARTGGPKTVSTQPDISAATSVTIPSGISNKLLDKGEKHYYRLPLQANVRYLIQTTTQEVNSPASLYLVLSDAKKNKVANSNPEADITQIDFTPTVAGDYLLTVDHLHYGGGPDQSYRLVINTYRPSFSLTATVDRLDLAKGSHAVLIVQADRTGGYNGPIELNVEKPLCFASKATMAAGQSAVMLPIELAGEMPIECKPLVIAGTGMVNGVQVKQYVSIQPALKQAMNDLLFPAMAMGTLPAVSTQPPVPFTLRVEPEHGHGVRGLPMPMRFTVNRKPGFTGEVTIASMHLPGQPNQKPVIAPLTAKVAAEQGSGTGSHQIEPNAPDGQPVAYVAKAIVEGREVTITVPPMKVALGSPVLVSTLDTSFVAKKPVASKMTPRPTAFLLRDLFAGPLAARSSLFDLNALPVPLAASTVEVRISRLGGYAGPVSLKLLGLPAGVTAGTVTLQPGQERGSIPIVAAAGTKAVSKNDVKVEATAPAAGNQKATSQPISIVVK